MKPVLSVARPDLAAQWVDAERDADTVTVGSGYKALWRCPDIERHTWRATVASRVRLNAGCPICLGKKPDVGVNDLATLYPEIAAQLSEPGLDPESLLPQSNKTVRWTCNLGHSWYANPRRRVREKTGCPTCGNRVVLPGFNDLATTHPHIAAELHDSDIAATAVVAGSNRSATWQCSLGHTWRAKIVNRTRFGNGCPVCAGRIVVAGFNNLRSTHPAIADQWDDAFRTADSVSRGTKYKARWKCEQGHKWEAFVSDRCRGQGCPECAATRFVSAFESEIASYIRSILPGTEVQTSVRRYRREGVHELDIFIPALSLAIEANGAYYHSEACGKGKDYHRDKLLRCRELGIQLIQVWDDEWSQRRFAVEQMLAHKLGASRQERIPARKTTARFINAHQARDFLDRHHIQGWASGSFYTALVHEDELVAVMVLKRVAEDGRILRLERYATSAIVAGGQSKLIRFLEANVPIWTELVTFADLQVSMGQLYERSGWVYDGEIAPDYRYLVAGKRAHKFGYRLDRFRQDPGLLFEENKTEAELAQMNGILRVWDSGKSRYRYERRL